MPPNLSVTSDTFWSSALFVAIIDLVLVSLLVWRISPSHFRELQWAIVGSAATFWTLLSAGVLWGTWDTYYRYFFPEVTRWLPPLLGLLCAAIGFVLYQLAVRLPGNPVITLMLLAGVESLLEHLWGIYGLGILDKVPMLQNASAESVLVFAFFEYILYWSVILGIASLADAAWRRRTVLLRHAPS